MAIYDFLIIFFPAMIANAFPVILGNIPYFTNPINIKLLGKNKTWKGLIFGILVGGLTGYCIEFLSKSIDHPMKMNLQIGLLMGSGVLFGDLMKSYFKRRLRIEPGKDWFPFDQIDWIVGAYIFTYPLFSFFEFLLLLLIGSGLHVLTNEIAYRLKLKIISKK